jgi:hypothetical protein
VVVGWLAAVYPWVERVQLIDASGAATPVPFKLRPQVRRADEAAVKGQLPDSYRFLGFRLLIGPSSGALPAGLQLELEDGTWYTTDLAGNLFTKVTETSFRDLLQDFGPPETILASGGATGNGEESGPRTPYHSPLTTAVGATQPPPETGSRPEVIGQVDLAFTTEDRRLFVAGWLAGPCPKIERVWLAGRHGLPLPASFKVQLQEWPGVTVGADRPCAGYCLLIDCYSTAAPATLRLDLADGSAYVAELTGRLEAPVPQTTKADLLRSFSPLGLRITRPPPTAILSSPRGDTGDA